MLICELILVSLRNKGDSYRATAPGYKAREAPKSDANVKRDALYINYIIYYYNYTLQKSFINSSQHLELFILCAMDANLNSGINIFKRTLQFAI